MGGTATVLHLAALAGAPVAFTSTMLPLGGTAPSGYRQTKAAAEAVCERLFKTHGVPSAPLQLGDIGMATAAGSVVPDDDAFVIVLKACVALGLFPDVPWASSLMAVDQCASLFVRLLQDGPADEFTGVASEVKGSLVPWSTLYEWVRCEVPALRLVPLDEWREAANARNDSLFQRLSLVLDDFADEQVLEGKRLAGGDGVDVTRQGVSLTVGVEWGRQLASTIRDELAEEARSQAAATQAALEAASPAHVNEAEPKTTPPAGLHRLHLAAAEVHDEPQPDGLASDGAASGVPRVPSLQSLEMAASMRQAGKKLKTLTAAAVVKVTGGRLVRSLSFARREGVKHKLRSAPANVRKVFKRAVTTWRENRERRAREQLLLRGALGTAVSAMLIKNLGYAPLVVSSLGLRQPGAFDGSDESVVLLWWAALLVNSMVQLTWFFHVQKRIPYLTGPQRKRFACAAAYLIGSAVRALYPVNWEVRPHACMFNTWADRFVGRVLGGELIDRVLAMVMELAIAHLVCSAISDVCLVHARTRSAKLARSCQIPVVIAQLTCWVGVVTDNKAFHIVEESLWAAAFAVLLVVAASTLEHVVRHHPSEVGQRWLLSAVCPLITLYLLFLFVHDIPMYVRQWLSDEEKGVQYNAIGDGLQALLRCDAVERSFGLWQVPNLKPQPATLPPLSPPPTLCSGEPPLCSTLTCTLPLIDVWQEGLPWMTATFVPGPYIAILLLEASVRSEAAIHGRRSWGFRPPTPPMPTPSSSRGSRRASAEDTSPSLRGSPS